MRPILTVRPERRAREPSPQSKDHYLRWVGQVDSGGAPTDPLDAMAAAIRLQPDIIYFLTDGEFKKGVNLKLRSIKLPRTAIHTFAFGDNGSESRLRLGRERPPGEEARGHEHCAKGQTTHYQMIMCRQLCKWICSNKI